MRHPQRETADGWTLCPCLNLPPAACIHGTDTTEYFDANSALAAIRNLDGHEMNGRRLRVSFSNNSNLKDNLHAIGQVNDCGGRTDSASTASVGDSSPAAPALSPPPPATLHRSFLSPTPRTQRQENPTERVPDYSAVTAMTTHEAWDVLDAMKRLVEVRAGRSPPGPLSRPRRALAVSIALASMKFTSQQHPHTVHLCMR